MSTFRQQSRYQIGSFLNEEAGVKVYNGLDPLTGLPIRCYEFSGSAISDAELISSPHIPDILASCTREDQVQVFTNHLSNCKITQPQIAVAQAEAFLLDTAQALNDAAILGVVHGGICPERFLFDGAQFYIEGYGVHWGEIEGPYYPNEQSLAGDIYAWAISVKELLGETPPKQIDSIISSCLAEIPSERPNAQSLLENLSSVYFYISKDSDLDSLPAQTEEAINSLVAEGEFSNSHLKTKTISEPKFYESGSNLEEQDPSKNEPANHTTKPENDLLEAESVTGISAEIAQDSNIDLVSEDSDVSHTDINLSSEVENNKLLLGPEKSFDESHKNDEALPKFSNEGSNYLNKESASESQEWGEAFSKKVNDSDKVKLKVDSKKSWVEELLEQKQQEAKLAESPPEDTEIDTELIEEIDFEDGGLEMTNIAGIYGTKEKSGRSFPLSLIFLIVGVLAATAITLYFFFSEQKNALPVPVEVDPAPPGIRYIIYPEFPADLRLIELLVISSPKGSSKPAGSILGTLTSSRQPIFLDKEGKWQLQARFEEHLSNILDVTVPLDNLQAGLEFEFQ